MHSLRVRVASRRGRSLLVGILSFTRSAVPGRIQGGPGTALRFVIPELRTGRPLLPPSPPGTGNR